MCVCECGHESANKWIFKRNDGNNGIVVGQALGLSIALLGQVHSHIINTQCGHVSINIHQTNNSKDNNSPQHSETNLYTTYIHIYKDILMENKRNRIS